MLANIGATTRRGGPLFFAASSVALLEFAIQARFVGKTTRGDGLLWVLSVRVVSLRRKKQKSIFFVHLGRRMHEMCRKK